MVQNKLIAHVLLLTEKGYLVIRRTEIKRGEENVYPGYWDIPGGTVEDGEMPQSAAIREVFEETGQQVEITKIIHEDSHYDKRKDIIFTRLVYLGKLIDLKSIQLDPEEHTEYNFIFELNNEENFVDYLKEIFDGM